MSAMTPLTKGARHQRIVEIVTTHPVRSQTGCVVTISTIRWWRAPFVRGVIALMNAPGAR